MRKEQGIKNKELRIKEAVKGFTILELLVVMGIIGLLAVIAYPTYSQMKDGVAVRQHSSEVVNALRSAQHRAIIAQDGIGHGVHFDSDGFVIFGGSWAAPTYTFAQKFSNGVEVTQGSGTEIIFDKLTGDAQDIEIKVGITSGQEKTVYITEYGRIVMN